MSNLDAKLRVHVRDEIAQLQRRLGITTVYVTHDQEEAMAISSRIAVMQSGEIAQIGTPEELYRRPTSAFVASFLGRANLMRGTIAGKSGTDVSLSTATGVIALTSDDAPPVGAHVHAVLRPEAIQLDAGETASGLPGTIISRTYLGEKVEYVVRIGQDLLQVVRPDPPDLSLFEAGATVSVQMPTGRIQIVRDDMA